MVAMKSIHNATEEVYPATEADTSSISERGSPETIDVPGYDATLKYDDLEARRAVRKVDIFVLPFIVLLFCFLQFDRTNVANALTDTIKADIHVGNTQINLATTLFTLGFVITELPFNMISKVVGPERFLPFTMLLWGTATAAQASLKSASGLYAARFMIGALEGGYIPGMVLYISKFYTNEELGLRYACFWASNSAAGILGGPLSIGLLSLRGKHGLAGWKWLFLVEGICTCFLAVVAYLYLPHNPASPKVFFGKSYNIFTPREASIIVTRSIRNDPGKGSRVRKPVLASHILETFVDWRLYGHLVAAFLSMIMISGMNTYSPSIIKSLGFTGLQANGLNSVGSACALILSLSLAYSSDRMHERAVHIAVGYLWGAVGLLWLALAPIDAGKWILYGGVVITQMGMGSAQAINAAWLTAKMAEHKRPVALACYVMSIQIANFPGSQLFQSRDAPRYRHGFITAASCAIAAAVIILVWKVLYRVFDHGDGGVEIEHGGEGEDERITGSSRNGETGSASKSSMA